MKGQKDNYFLIAKGSPVTRPGWEWVALGMNELPVSGVK